MFSSLALLHNHERIRTPALFPGGFIREVINGQDGIPWTSLEGDPQGLLLTREGCARKTYPFLSIFCGIGSAKHAQHLCFSTVNYDVNGSHELSSAQLYVAGLPTLSGRGMGMCPGINPVYVSHCMQKTRLSVKSEVHIQREAEMQGRKSGGIPVYGVCCVGPVWRLSSPSFDSVSFPKIISFGSISQVSVTHAS